MEIPVKKTSGIPWWLWLIAALLLAGLIWWLVASLDDDADTLPTAAAPVPGAGILVPSTAAPGLDGSGQTPEQTPPAQPVNAAAEGATAQGTITNLGTVLQSQNRRELIGREFQLTGVRVLDVVGDRTFFVGDGDRRVFAALREAPPPGWPTDADININPRQTVSMRGTVADASGGDLAGRPLQSMPAGTDIVLFAQTADVLTRP